MIKNLYTSTVQYGVNNSAPTVRHMALAKVTVRRKVPLSILSADDLFPRPVIIFAGDL